MMVILRLMTSGEMHLCGLLHLLPARTALRLQQRPVHPGPHGHVRSRLRRLVGRHLGDDWPHVDLRRQVTSSSLNVFLANFLRIQVDPSSTKSDDLLP